MQDPPHKQFVKKLRDENENARMMFRKLYGRKEENYREVQQMINNLNRGTYSMEFVALLVKTFGLENVTMGEFFLGKEPEDKEQNPKD
ncbi:hypothetical protein KIH87_14215 [Paraneptunicella aestuarii]|uniref:hypothetical protein n=1 Tax=Paraneptunicella aestuarii TaxID=2831148 RepID=UPI001E417117|nr:hypothetical protein [Paraneptunicella aestuarii]UAA37845.1 hypothetical protein KIH87_14215 [Paraneptunicella aestuarii]